MKNLLLTAENNQILLVLMLLSFTIGRGQVVTQTYTTSTTFTVPAGVTQVSVEAWGGGGKGGTINGIGYGGGGGGGAYSSGLVTVVPGNTYTVTVGTGATTTAAGGDSWFDTATTILAKGGGSVANNSTAGAAGGSAAASIGTTKYSGGNGANGSAILIIGGGGGSSAGTAAAGNSGANNNGGTAPAGGGDGGNGSALVGNGSPGISPGGAGGGAYGLIFSLFTGGVGANGQVKLTYTLVPEITVSGNGNTIADGDASPSTTDWTDLGTTTGATCSLTKTFTIANIAAGDLSVGAISISGTNAADFSVTTLPASTVVYGGSTTFVVTFTPSGSGVRTANLSIANSDADENTYDFAISGTGSNPEINIQGNATSISNGDVTPSTVDGTDFGSMELSSGTVVRTFAIQNTGGSTLTLSNPTISGANAADFSVTTNPGLSVTAGNSTTFTITFNPSAAGTRTATITIANIDCDESSYTFGVQGTGIVYTNGPGGVLDDLQLWLRADLIDGTTTVSDNSNVSTWYTQAGGANAIKPAAVGSPVYKNNTSNNLNFNAVVDFTNNYNLPSQVYTDTDSSRQYLRGASGFYTNDMFVVIVPDVSVTASLSCMDIFCGDQVSEINELDTSGVGYGNSTTRFTNEVLAYGLGTSAKYGVGEVSTTASYSSAGIINARNNTANTGMQLCYNENSVGTAEVNTATYGNVNNSQFWIGRSEGWDGSLDGRVAEIITFSSRKNDATERAKIQSYLAIKYGITLGTNGTSQNYLSSTGTTLWNTATNAGYNYNIAGIGRDDISKLNQKQSKNGVANSVVTIGLGTIASTNTANTNTFDTDGEYLVWGENGGNMNDSGSDISVTFGGNNVTTLIDVPNKKWKIVETGGNVGITKAAVATSDLSGLPALSGNDAYVMLVADDASFTTNVEAVFLNTNGANQEALYDFDGTKFFTFGVAHETVASRHVSLDGVDDRIKFDAVNNLSNAFTMMFWVRPTGQNTLSNDRTIASKYDGTTGYRVYLSTDNKINVSWTGGTTVTSATVLPTSVWHNIGIIYSGGSVKLYIDGVLDSTVASSSPSANVNTFSIGAEYRSKSDTRNYFKGDIDEFRLWDKALTLNELRFIMNQEIFQNGTGTKGGIVSSTITKNDISTLNWSNLIAYYSMNSFIATYVNDDSSNTNRGTLFVPNKVTVTLQSSPVPYETATNDLWSNGAAWANSSGLYLPNSLSIVDGVTPIDWGIVKTSHNLSSTGNKKLLGLVVNNNTLTVSNDSKIEISHYLKLDGKIDLQGKSQLIQTTDSDLDANSIGSLERDQQGQSIKYNYNYWSSPVSSINNTTINHGFTVAGVMKDATDVNNIQNLQWTAGVNGSPTTPITLSSYWIFKFQNSTNNYANWAQVGPNGTLLPGQGYTMKGCGSAAADQNYTFVGKPNNGTITSTVGPNNLNLCGNPYPSAIDANQFIDDNASSITGTLYLWEHYNTNPSHTTIQYQGGYATYTKTGGTAPIAPAGISGAGSSSKTPKRFIPVGQGFFVTGSTSGGTITFNNGQRLFIKEDDAVNSYAMFKMDRGGRTSVIDPMYNNTPDSFEQEQFTKIKLGYTSKDNYHRQILLGFMNQHATAAYDAGYDGLSIETPTNDMYFINGANKLNISGDGYFNPNNIYPLGVKNATAGTVVFGLDSLENFNDRYEIYIYDSEDNTYNSIKTQNFKVSLPVGTFENRFSLRFTNSPTSLRSLKDDTINYGIEVTNSQSDNMINIKNELEETTVKSVALFNMVGQNMMNWTASKQNQKLIQLPVSELSTGTYIVKVNTDKGIVTKKILIK
ncbi:choice-of-anchor D domain-containing protein [Flavobacterium sangjuense]|uniref:LamG-like jellyroll fold domain-containing protein n=1 Tax=Flavobacterium sangjuense TaxID=2518177 RepID=A0A4P7PXW1_9FLAO|nr:choice-of-anchor D domain-containing protein [Flavobacterium sangjuense]QBZ98933.1 hypothetical protein GS03_02445 [Flavobacterium sangjuense]